MKHDIHSTTYYQSSILYFKEEDPLPLADTPSPPEHKTYWLDLYIKQRAACRLPRARPRPSCGRRSPAPPAVGSAAGRPPSARRRTRTTRPPCSGSGGSSSSSGSSRPSRTRRIPTPTTTACPPSPTGRKSLRPTSSLGRTPQRACPPSAPRPS